MTAIYWLLPGLLFLAVLAASVFFSTKRSWMNIGRRPRRLHPVIRIICGALGVLIVGAIAVGTLKDAWSVYAPPEQASTATLRVPTKPAPPLPVPDDNRESREIEKARVLLQFVLLDYPEFDRSPARAVPIRAAEVELRWPQDKGKLFDVSMTARDLDISLKLRIDDLWSWWVRGEKLELRGRGLYQWDYRARSHLGRTGDDSSRTEPDFFDQVQLMVGVEESMERVNEPLSTAGKVLLPGRRELILIMTSVAEDDPLKAAPLREFVDSKMDDISRLYRFRVTMARSQEPWVGRMPMRGVLLAEHTGLSALLLLVAAILFAMLFARRGLAFAGTLAAMVLYVAILDRIVLGIHMSKLEDMKAPPRARSVACLQVSDTFFYRETARERIQAVAGDAKAPASLRDEAKTVLSEMKQQDRD